MGMPARRDRNGLEQNAQTQEKTDDEVHGLSSFSFAR